MAADPARAIAYIRSAVPTANKEHCTEGRALRIERYCQERRLRLVGSFADQGVAGAVTERVGLRDALALLAEGRADVLVVVNVSQLTRSMAALARLTQAHFGYRTHGLIGTVARWDAGASRHAR